MDASVFSLFFFPCFPSYHQLPFSVALHISLSLTLIKFDEKRLLGLQDMTT